MIWLRIIRPHTLFASLCPVLVALIAIDGTVVDAFTAVVTIVCALALQVLSNLINDYYDFLRGTDKKGRVGFRRALAEGEVNEKDMLMACVVTLSVCIICGGWLIYVGGWVIMAIGLSALLFAWLYTATAYSLSYLGIADVFVFLYYGVVASCGTYYLQQGVFSWQIFCAGAVSGLISMCVLFINNLRDVDDDRVVGKKTLPVRFGVNFVLVLMFVVIMLMPLMAYTAFGRALPMLVVIPAMSLYIKVIKANGAEYNRCLMAAGLLNLVYTILVVMNRYFNY